MKWSTEPNLVFHQSLSGYLRGGIETADMMVNDIPSRGLEDRRVGRYYWCHCHNLTCGRRERHGANSSCFENLYTFLHLSEF